MQEMMNCINPSALDRQRALLQWQQLQQDNNNCFTIENMFSHFQNDQGLVDGWPNLSITSQYPIDKRDAEEEEEEEEELGTTTNATTGTPTVSNSTSSAQVGKQKSSKKRKAVGKSLMVSGEEEEKRMKGSDSGNNSSKENNESDKMLDYILVRARRGQATDSHSLAERVRRERISERMKHLQGLVPGCNKITGKAGMLDEIINYVQSLQRQVEFLSMKLAAVNPRLDINMEALFSKELNLQCNSGISTVGGLASERMDPSLLQLTSLQQVMAICGLDMTMMNATDLALRRTISAPVSAPEPYLDSCLSVQRTTSSGWDNELHSLYGAEFHQGRGSSSFPFHSLQGNILPNNLKREM